MGKGIYTHYKERLVEIGGKNRCLYLKSVVKKNAYDIGKIFEGRDEKVSELVDFLWNGRKHPMTLISRDETREIVKNLTLPTRTRNAPDTANMNPDDSEAAWHKYKKNLAEDSAILVENEIAKVKELVREVEDIEKETGRYELYLGYPFVFGSINQGATKTLVKAPLILFPVKVEFGDDTVEIRHNPNEKIQINKALVFAYAQAKRLNVDGLELEFDDLSGFKNVKSVVDYLASARIRIDCNASKQLYTYSRFKEPESKGDLSVRYGALLARLSL